MLHTNKHDYTTRDTDRQAGRQAGRQADRQKEREDRDNKFQNAQVQVVDTDTRHTVQME